jgi:hypothetical protein
MTKTCKNCGSCTCSGSQLTVASNGQECCTKCIGKIEDNLRLLREKLNK